MLCLHIVHLTVHSQEIMDILIMAKYCRCILIKNELINTKVSQNIICTMTKYAETFDKFSG